MNEPLPISSRARGGRWLPIILLPAVVLLCFMAHATVSGSRGSGSGDNYPGSDGGQKHRRRLAEEGKDGHEEAANVFAIALTGMNQSDVGWMMVAVIFSQLVLDEVLRRVEASVGANARACLREVYKELSTLGLISFSLFLVQSFEVRVDAATLHAFEYSHIFVFSFAIVYVIQSAVLIASINPIQRRLIRLHAYGDAVAAALDIGPFVPPATADRVKRGNGGWLSALSDLRWGETSGLAARRAFDGFRAFRRRFWGKYALPPSFLYDRYLIEVYDRWVLVKLDIASWCWILMAFLFGLHALVAHFPHVTAFALNRWTFLVYGWLLLLADVGLFYLVHRVHTRVLCRLRRDGPTGSGLGVSSNSQLQGPEQYDAVEALRKRRKALYAQYYQKAQRQQNGTRTLPPPAAAALQGEAGMVVGSVNATSHSSLHGDMVLHHPPRQWTFGGDGGGDATNNHSPHLRADASTDDSDADGSRRDQNGFRPWEAFAFNYGLEALNIVRCLYLAAWLCTYAVPAFLEWFSVGWALLYVLVVPVPALITGTVLIPRMVTRFLLVTSLSVLDLEAFDAVVEYMDEADAALKEIAVLLRRLADEAAADGSSSSSSSSKSSRAKEKDGAERLFAFLAQQHQNSVHSHLLARPTLPSFFSRNAKRAHVAPAPKSVHVSYAQLLDFLQRHGVHLSARRFRALVRFFDSDLCGHVDLQDFKSLFQGDHLFCAVAQHPSARRVARRLSQQSQQGQQQQERVLLDVGRLLRHGSSVLDDWQEEGDEGGGGEAEEVA